MFQTFVGTEKCDRPTPTLRFSEYIVQGQTSERSAVVASKKQSPLYGTRTIAGNPCGASSF